MWEDWRTMSKGKTVSFYRTTLFMGRQLSVNYISLISNACPHVIKGEDNVLHWDCPVLMLGLYVIGYNQLEEHATDENRLISMVWFLTETDFHSRSFSDSCKSICPELSQQTRQQQVVGWHTLPIWEFSLDIHAMICCPSFVAPEMLHFNWRVDKSANNCV